MADGTLSIEEVIRLAVDAGLSRINTSMPGRVESYDPVTQRADITPVLQRPVYTAAGAVRPDTLPRIFDVRVIHPGGEDFAIHVPLKQGDTVLLVFQQLDPTTWQRTGEVSAPLDKRAFSLSHAVALPGYRVDSKPITGASSDALTFHHSSGFRVSFKNGTFEIDGATESVALAGEVDSQLNDLKTLINGWIPTPNDGGAGLKAVLAAWISDLCASSSSKLKTGG